MVFRGWFYSYNYLPTLNILVLRPLYIFFHRPIGIIARVFTNGLGDRGSIPKTQKWYLKHYNVRIKSKWSDQIKEVAPSLTRWCRGYWKRSLWIALDCGHQLYLYIYIYICIIEFEEYIKLPSERKKLIITMKGYTKLNWKNRMHNYNPSFTKKKYIYICLCV